MNLPVEVITQSGQLYAAVQEIGGSKAIAVDTEANSRHRYPEQLCLIQLATLDKIFVIDTIKLKEIGPLKDIFLDASIIKVFHTADYDIRSLNRHFGFQIHGVFDTAIAARFTGISKFGLATLLEDLLKITIEKSQLLQKADWGKRPLSSEALEYAANDVRHLLSLKDFLDKRLRELGRTTWVTQECSRLEELRYEPGDPETAFLSLKGANKLNGSSLAVLKPLFMFREKEALKQNRPPYFVIPHSTLLYLAANPKADLSKTPGLGKTGLERFGQGLQRALTEGLAGPPIYRGTTEKLTREDTELPKLDRAEQDQRLKHLKAWRESMGKLLSLDQSLIWPRVSLERLACAPDTLDIELTSGDIRRWQHDNFASSLSILLESL
ncbi:MAG: HRDC domain-containing protein [Dehalococcoidales bacterium]